MINIFSSFLVPQRFDITITNINTTTAATTSITIITLIITFRGREMSPRPAADEEWGKEWLNGFQEVMH